jgi:hypothetical protein
MSSLVSLLVPGLRMGGGAPLVVVADVPASFMPKLHQTKIVSAAFNYYRFQANDFAIQETATDYILSAILTTEMQLQATSYVAMDATAIRETEMQIEME